VPRCEDSFYSLPRIRKGLVGVLLGALHDPIQFVLAHEGSADVIGGHVAIDAAPEPLASGADKQYICFGVLRWPLGNNPFAYMVRPACDYCPRRGQY
jgi:hypothetical protein